MDSIILLNDIHKVFKVIFEALKTMYTQLATKENGPEETHNIFRDTTVPELHDPKIIGLLEMISKTVYSVNLKTLLHLGTKNMCLG